MTILVDMDDVLEQLVNGWTSFLNHEYGTEVSPDAVTDWDVSLAFPTLSKEQVYSVTLRDELWDYVYPTPGADEVLRRLMAEGHEIFVVTATTYETLRAKMDRVLFRYFPYIDWHHVIITDCKAMVRGDVLIDDKPENLLGGSYRRILFTARHNKTFDAKSIGAVRADTWEEVYSAIQELCS